MHYYYSPSAYPNFTRRHFNICPACAGIKLTEYKQANLPNLLMCPHHREELRKLKIKNFEEEETRRKLREQHDELDKILSPQKNLIRQQKILEIKSQLIKEVA